ncbi:cell division cycle-associated protein 3 [Pleurodeles waltl]|uniref:cell division cycle-associated protein 3 n=1 Tax=Pleurodeles waltl TaxID=8319 RepID=UPI0037096CE7
MGSAGSKQPITPARPLRNKHLSHVSDPRSPTSGIPRTPIEVEQSSARVTPQAVDEDAQEPVCPRTADPRSPTHGILRTPLKPTVTEALHSLVKQLSQAFTYEEGVRPGIDQETTQVAEEEAEQSWAPLLRMEVESGRLEQETEMVQQAPDHMLEAEEKAPGQEPLKAQVEETAATLEISDNDSRTQVNDISPEEVELAMGLLRLADIGLPAEGTEQKDLPILDLGLPVQNVDLLKQADSGQPVEEGSYKVSREEEIEYALGLLRLADVSNTAKEMGPEGSPDEVAAQIEAISEIPKNFSEMPNTPAEPIVEPDCINDAEKEYPQAGCSSSVLCDVALEVRVKSEAMPRTRLLSSPASRPTGVKALRQKTRKATGKVLAAPGVHTRSPLKILGDDNSPSNVTHRPVKRHPMLSDSSNERLESTNRPLKLVRGWENVHDKENAQYPMVDN